MSSYFKASKFPGSIYVLVDKTFVNWVRSTVEINGYEKLSENTTLTSEFVKNIISGNCHTIDDSSVDQLVVYSRMDKTMNSFNWYSKEQLAEKNIYV